MLGSDLRLGLSEVHSQIFSPLPSSSDNYMDQNRTSCFGVMMKKGKLGHHPSDADRATSSVPMNGVTYTASLRR